MGSRRHASSGVSAMVRPDRVAILMDRERVVRDSGAVATGVPAGSPRSVLASRL